MTRPLSISIVSGKFRPHYELATPKAAESIPIVEGLFLALHAPTWIGRITGWFKLLLSGFQKKQN
jgi:hypothetical protein